jgi:hypothetical protein
MNDVLGREIQQGDKVAIAFNGETAIRIGKVLSFTNNEKVRVEVGTRYYLRLPAQVCRVEINV